MYNIPPWNLIFEVRERCAIAFSRRFRDWPINRNALRDRCRIIEIEREGRVSLLYMTPHTQRVGLRYAFIPILVLF